MCRIVILGAGTGGTMMANRLCDSLRPEIENNEHSITIVDKNREHVYQPGMLFIPFGVYKDKHDLVKPRENFLPREVEFIVSPSIEWTRKRIPCTWKGVNCSTAC